MQSGPLTSQSITLRLVSVLMMAGAGLAFSPLAVAEVCAAKVVNMPGPKKIEQLAAGDTARSTTSNTATASIQMRCLRTNVVITASARKDALLACSASRGALGHLKRLGVDVDRRIHVDVASGPVMSGSMQCYGRFDPTANKVSIASISYIGTLLRTDSPYSSLPSHIVFLSVISHEIVHAALHDARPHAPLSRTAQEYVAYVIELSLMTPRSRQSFLRASPSNVPPHISQLTELALMMAPQAFGATAYRHYSKVPNQPKFLLQVLRGEIEFPVTNDEPE